jgi:hypothetical protein
MSIAKLQYVAAQRLPFNVSDFGEVDEVRVLMAAGLIAGLRMRVAAVRDGPTSPMVRVLAITPDGRRLLRRCGAEAADSSFATFSSWTPPDGVGSEH